MENKTSADGTKESKISQNVLIAIIGAITTIVATVLPWALNKYNSGPSPTPVPIIITVTSPPTLPPTNTSLPTLTETSAPTFTPTVELPTATATQQVGIYNLKLATNISGVNVTTQFKPAQTIYVIFDVNDPAGLNLVNLRWSVVEVKGYKADAEIASSPYSVKNNHFELGFDHSTFPWRTGKYKLQVFLNDVLDETIEFEIIQ